MGRRSTVERLPADIRAQFIEHVRQNPGWTLDSHVEWFSDRGYTMARSSIHRYISGSIERPSIEYRDTSDVDLRMRALEVASGIYKGCDLQELIAAAEQLLAWVEQPA